jgi:hypothetical protein
MLQYLGDRTLLGIVMRQVVILLSVRGHYDRTSRVPLNDEGGFHDALCSRVLERTLSRCPAERVPYLEGTRGTGGWVSREVRSKEDRERGDGLDLLRRRMSTGDGPPSKIKG